MRNLGEVLRELLQMRGNQNERATMIKGVSRLNNIIESFFSVQLSSPVKQKSKLFSSLTFGAKSPLQYVLVILKANHLTPLPGPKASTETLPHQFFTQSKRVISM